MIKILPVSHVSKESLKKIDEEFNEFNPSIVALELDPLRLKALKEDKPADPDGIFLKILSKAQAYLGKKTGVIPGYEMVYAHDKALDEGREVVFIDQDIRTTIYKINKVSRKEKVKAIFYLLIGLISSYRKNIEDIPDKNEIKEIEYYMENKFPELSRILLEERNNIMAGYLKNLEMQNPDKDILAVVGAAHKPGIQSLLGSNQLKN
ncbi:MAG: TraB domain-containing protein [Candidatus Nanohaloarchaea archaeon]